MTHWALQYRCTSPENTSQPACWETLNSRRNVTHICWSPLSYLIFCLLIGLNHPITFFKLPAMSVWLAPQKNIRSNKSNLRGWDVARYLTSFHLCLCSEGKSDNAPTCRRTIDKKVAPIPIEGKKGGKSYRVYQRFGQP